MGKTCHLPGTRNHLVGDAERLERKPRKTPRENPGITIARKPIITDYFLDYLSYIDEKLEEGKKKGKTESGFRTFSPESIIWELLNPDKWDEIYDKHVEKQGYSNTTRRSRAQNTRQIRDRMRQCQQELLLGKYWHVNPDTGLCDEPATREGYALERNRYVKINNETLGVQIDLHESTNQDLLAEDASIITEMLYHSGIKVKVEPQDISTTFGLVGGASIPTKRSQSLLMPDTPVIPVNFDEMQIV